MPIRVAPVGPPGQSTPWDMSVGTVPRGEQRYWRSVQDDPAIKQVFTGRGACGDGGSVTAPSTAPWWKNLGE